MASSALANWAAAGKDSAAVVAASIKGTIFFMNSPIVEMDEHLLVSE
jgi:hypothetical protein